MYIRPLGMFKAVLPFAGIHGDDAGPINVHVHGDDNAPNEGPVVLSSMAYAVQWLIYVNVH